MQAGAHPRKERSKAAAIFAVAVGVAAWVLLHRAPAPPSPPVLTVEPEPPRDPAAVARAMPQTSMAIELVELPANMFPPAPSAPSQTAETKQPAAQPQSDAPAPTKPAPSPQKVATPVQPPRPVEEAPPVKTAEVTPVTPEPQKQIVPLRPETEKPALAPAPLPVVAQQTPSPSVVPLQPEDRATAQVVPLQPEKAAPRPVETAQTKPITPLRPGDEKPAVRPIVIAEAEPPPLKPVEKVIEKPIEKKIARLDVEKPVPPPVERLPEIKVKPEPVKLAQAYNPPPPPAPPKTTASVAPPPPAPMITPSEQTGDGRALLRIFEQGYGPSIEIRWPSESFQRAQLYTVLVRCLGMRVGIVDNEGHLYLGEGERNQPSNLNTDKYSGFVRRPDGAIADDEQREIARVRAYHQAMASAPPARIFPRHVDAYLIGGLRQAVGEDYLKMKSIHATYRLSGGRVVVDSINADGHSINGAIDLSAVATGCPV